MTFLLIFGCIITFLAPSLATVPEGYILQVTPLCGTDIAQDASINIITDLNVEAKAICAHEMEVDFTSTDEVNFNISVSYPNQGSQPCVFKKRANALVFTVKVIVSYGEAGSLVHQNEEDYTVSCTFGPKGVDSSSNQTILTGLIAPTEIQTNMGQSSQSTFTLEMIDVVGNSLDSIDIHLGKTVMLKAVTSGIEGIRPVSCDAIDGSTRYAILRAGCGDGIIFSKTAGFLTDGTSTTSPYFSVFSINAGAVINFECKFIVCTKCDGSSCDNI